MKESAENDTRSVDAERVSGEEPTVQRERDTTLPALRAAVPIGLLPAPAYASTLERRQRRETPLSTALPTQTHRDRATLTRLSLLGSAVDGRFLGVA